MNQSENDEYDALLARYFELLPPSPGTRCFCGSLEDLREAVARLQVQHQREFSG